MNKKGLSLLEILISSVILALLMAGLVNLFVAGKRHIVHTRSRMAGGELGRLFFDYLQMHVREDTWLAAGNALQTGVWNCPPSQPGCPTALERTFGAITYGAQYTITRNAPINNVNRVTVNIAWTEPAP